MKSKTENIRYAEFNEKSDILIDGKSYPCLSGFGCEYLEASNNEKGCGYPFAPLRFHRIVNDSFGYLIDACGIIWIYGEYQIGELTFYRSCFKDCAYQILLKEESDFCYESLNQYLYDDGGNFFSSDMAKSLKGRYNEN